MSKTELIRELIGENALFEWEVLEIEGKTWVAVYWPSEKAFYESCSLRPGGKGRSEEGERMRKEALRIRSVVLKEFPEVKVGFTIKEVAQ